LVKQQKVATFKLKIYQNPFGAPELLSGCGPGKREMGEKERCRGTEDGRKRAEGRIEKFVGERGSWKVKEEKGGKGTFASS